MRIFVNSEPDTGHGVVFVIWESREISPTAITALLHQVQETVRQTGRSFFVVFPRWARQINPPYAYVFNWDFVYSIDLIHHAGKEFALMSVIPVDAPPVKEFAANDYLENWQEASQVFYRQAASAV